MHIETSKLHDAAQLRIAIAVSRYHSQITDALLRGARAAHNEAGGSSDDLIVVESPGAYELIVTCTALVRADRQAGQRPLDAIVALGCVITGETTHDQYINAAVSQSLAALVVETGVPITFGLLTCFTMEQAKARAGGEKGNKGVEAMHAAIAAAQTVRSIHDTLAVSEPAQAAETCS